MDLTEPVAAVDGGSAGLVEVDATAAAGQGDQQQQQGGAGSSNSSSSGRMFTLKKWNAVAMWSWDVECDTCAICRVQVELSVKGRNAKRHVELGCRG
jgi:Anaphase-promoting complex subunit 11 RING-H2 finger